jgi:hypothetical protein
LEDLAGIECDSHEVEIQLSEVTLEVLEKNTLGGLKWMKVGASSS